MRLRKMLTSRGRERRDLIKLVTATPIPILNCPTRREHIEGRPIKIDYALCGGGADKRREGSISFDHHGIWDRKGTEVSVEKITDGTSKTYLIGEKAVDPRGYRGNSQGDTGTILDCDRGNCIRFAFKVPGPDAAGSCFACHDFGSAHRSQWNMVFCDGSVRGLRYDMDFAVHAALATPDGGELEAGQLD